MPLPGGLSTFTLTFGDYNKADGSEHSFAGMKGILSVSPPIVATTSGTVLIESVEFFIGNDGTASIASLVPNDDPGINQGTAYTVTFQALSSKPAPPNKTFVVRVTDGATVDYDKLTAVTGTVAVPPPGVTSVNGKTGVVALTAADVGAAPAGGGGAVTSVAGRTGAVSLAKADVGLGSVDNTADTAKPVSTAQAAALAAKAAVAGPNTWTGTQDFTGATVTGVGGGAVLTVASTVTTAGALVTGKHTPVDATSGPLTMTLPTGAASGTLIAAEKVDSSTNAVTVTGNMRGTAGQSITLLSQFEVRLFVADAAGSWRPVADHRTKSSLDASYGDAAVSALVTTGTSKTAQTVRSTLGPGVTAADMLGTNLVKVGQLLTTSAGSWDNDKVEGPCVIWDPVAGRWAMVYVGYNNTAGTLTAKVGLAYSDDLVNWTKQGTTPILAGTGVGGDPDQSGCSGPVLVYDSGVFHLFYIGLTASGYEAGTKTICHATATSLTGTWTRLGTIITPTAAAWRNVAVWHPNFVKKGSTWYCFFNANGANEQIGYATASSLNGPWTVDDVNSPIVTVGTTGAFDLTTAGDPCVRLVGSTWVMDYYGYNGTLDYSADGVATTSDANFPLGWTKYAGNPILVPTPGSLSYDNQYASKPWTMVVGGQVLHYYTAVASGNVRSIALAVTMPNGGTNRPYRNTATPASNNPTMLLSGKSANADASNLVLGDLIKPATATGRVRFEVGNTTGNSEAFIGQGPSNNLILGWTYNATAASASAKVETWSTSNTLNIQNTAGKLVLGGSAATVGLFGSAGTTKQAVTGSRSANAALASLLTILAGHGLLTDSSTA